MATAKQRFEANCDKWWDEHPEPDWWAIYQRLVEGTPKAIVLFQIGDFFESFEEDAELLHDEFGLVLYQRKLGPNLTTMMTGIPGHALMGYVRKFVAGGYNVQVVKQRAVTRYVDGWYAAGSIAEEG